jgi:membrane-bound lytic murein transglycosylase MltF
MNIFKKIGEKYNLNPYILAAIAYKESRLCPYAVRDNKNRKSFYSHPSPFKRL